MTVVLGDPGVLVKTTDVDRLLIQVLKKWLPTFLRIGADDDGLDLVPPSPVGASYNNPMDMTEWGDQQFPGVMVATAKTQGVPHRNSDGTYRVTWLSTVSFVVRGTTPMETRDRAAFYEGQGRRALGHSAALTDIMDTIQEIRWNGGTEVRPVTAISRTGRYIAAGMSTFLVKTERAFQDSAGPPVPDPEPPTPPPTYVPIGTVTEVDLTTAAENDDGDLVGAVTDHITDGG